MIYKVSVTVSGVGIFMHIYEKSYKGYKYNSIYQ